MAVTHTFERPSTFLVSASGSVTFAELSALFARLREDPNLSLAKVVLADARTATGAPNSTELRLLARQLKSIADLGVGAFAIVTTSLSTFADARMFAVFANSHGVRVAAFREMGEARLWLVNSADQPEVAQ